MTLEELLKDTKNKKACAEVNYKECIAREHGCEDCPFDHVGIDLLYPEIIERLEELKTLRKAYDLMAEELAVNKHCVMFPNCYIELDEEDCMLKEACHNKEWLKECYLQKARKENDD